jgi:hypothetical protein
MPDFETLEMTPGQFYFVADCPKTGKLIPIEHDPSHGKVPFDPNSAVVPVPCRHCQDWHEIPVGSVSSLLAGRKSG